MCLKKIIKPDNSKKKNYQNLQILKYLLMNLTFLKINLFYTNLPNRCLFHLVFDVVTRN